MTEAIDLLIRARWIIPVEPADTVLEHHALAVRGGRIVALLPEREAAERYNAGREVTLDRHVLMPGLVNLHCHAAMSLLRGLADDTPLMTWLQEHIWPAEGRHVSPDFVHDGTLLACAEMLRGGITCFNDMYFFPTAAAAAVREAGMRAVIGLPLLEFPTAYASDADDYLAKGLAARDELLGQPLLHFALAPHAPYTVSDRSFERVATLTGELDLPVHLHVHETAHEITESLKQHGVRPLERLRRLGIVNLTASGQTYGLGEPAGVCGTCHTNTLTQHDNGTRQISFGAGGTANTMGAGYGGSMSLLFGVSTPSFNSGAKTCSNLACHYFTTPNWY